MKSKINKASSTLFASLACLTLGTVGSISPVYASCENAPSVGSRFKFAGPESFKFRVAAQQFIDTKNARKLNFLVKSTDREAQAQIAEFFKGVANGNIDFENSGDVEFEVADQDMSQKDVLEGFEKSRLKLQTEVKDFDAIGSRKIGQCVEPGKMIIVVREVSADSIFAARSVSTLENESTKKDDNVAATTAVVNEENKGPKGYKSQVSGGYDGFADMEEF